MQLLTKNKALDLLERTLKESSALPREYSNQSDYREWEIWERTASVRVEAIFGSDSQHVKEFNPVMDRLKKQAHIVAGKDKYIDSVIALLRSFQSEIVDLWNDDVTTSNVIAEPRESGDAHSSQENKRVFIVHGHDHLRMQSLARFLERLGLEAVVLHEQASQGSTIMEKLESHGNTAFAVILLTPDDVGNTVKARDNLQPRARQNVVLELGYFMAKLGRRRTCALVVEGVEIPSDYSGIVYITIDDAEAWKFHLARELKAAGLPVDSNKAL